MYLHNHPQEQQSTSTKEVIDKLNLQQTVFGNLSRIVSYRGVEFTSKDFEEYCADQSIELIKITTSVMMEMDK